MTGWQEVLSEIEAELIRCCQKLDERETLPNAVRVRLDASVFGRWAPVLDQVTAEVGEALLDWAERRGSRWYQDCGPHLEVVLADEPVSSISLDFSDRASNADTLAVSVEDSP